MATYRLFRYVYYLGMLAGATLTIVAAARSLLYGQNTNPYLAAWIGVPHVVILSALARAVPPESRVQAGNQLQTAGYLHTLVGFSVLLTILGRVSQFEPGIVLGPLGSALITSICGWFFGGELVGRGLASEDDALRTEAGRVTGELRGFATAVRSAHEDYIRSVRGLLDEHRTLDEAHREALRRTTELATGLEKHLSGIVTTLANFERTVRTASEAIERGFGEEFRKRVEATGGLLKSVNDELGKVADGARETAKYLRESRLLLDELAKLASVIGATAPTR